mmetsp:Transcript_15040/g.23341  ORF Transcript_15040/g.23341 Transcript_15040/m.23341 type:complete len:87 (+) Transcript_15040:1729-1989(+)
MYQTNIIANNKIGGTLKFQDSSAASIKFPSFLTARIVHVSGAGGITEGLWVKVYALKPLFNQKMYVRLHLMKMSNTLIARSRTKVT